MQERAYVCINIMCRQSAKHTTNCKQPQHSTKTHTLIAPCTSSVGSDQHVQPLTNLGIICTRLKHCPWHAHLKFAFRVHVPTNTCCAANIIGLCSRPASELLCKLESSDPALFLSDVHRGTLFLVNVDVGILSGLGIRNPVDVKLAIGPPRLHDSRKHTWIGSNSNYILLRRAHIYIYTQVYVMPGHSITYRRDFFVVTRALILDRVALVQHFTLHAIASWQGNTSRQ